MIRRALKLFLLLPLAACSVHRPQPERVTGEPRERFTYRADVTAVPAHARSVRLAVRVPLSCAAGELERLTASGLVGNAPFELEVPDEPQGELVRENLTVRWSRVLDAGSGPRWRMVEVETAGQPIELGLRISLAAPASASDEAVAALEAELRERTSLDLDGGASEAVATRFARVR